MGLTMQMAVLAVWLKTTINKRLAFAWIDCRVASGRRGLYRDKFQT